MDMLRDISASGVVGDATRASRETGEKIVEALVPRIVQVAREMARKEP
jgi:creatinine amidohydrolase/Fe(II)-dependent formamide hydrolase-like protein